MAIVSKVLNARKGHTKGPSDHLCHIFHCPCPLEHGANYAIIITLSLTSKHLNKNPFTHHNTLPLEMRKHNKNNIKVNK